MADEGAGVAAAGLVFGEGGDGGFDHFFEAKGLGAELHFVGGVGFWFAAFVFDRDDFLVVRSGAVELDDVALAGESVNEGADGHAAGDADVVARFVAAVMGALVHEVALDREFVLRPNLFEMDEGALARAKEEVLEC